MEEWIVVEQFGNQVAGPFFDKQSADFFAQNTPQYSVERKK